MKANYAEESNIHTTTITTILLSLFSFLNRSLPWRCSRSDLKGNQEDVRPINWANRPKSYLKRTSSWDEYPNGRWGDSRSPAFGELSDSHLFQPSLGNVKDRLAMWGESPITLTEIYAVFSNYIEGKIPIIPWCETALLPETTVISLALSAMCKKGFMTINSQPAVNGEKSDHPVYGWGGSGGRIYQKAYVEFFCSPENLDKLLEKCKSFSNIAIKAVDSQGNIKTNCSELKDAVALTWGVFANKEIIQPTVFDINAFLVWSKEAFKLWIESWAVIYDDETESSALLYEVTLLRATTPLKQYFVVIVVVVVVVVVAAAATAAV